MRRMIVLILLTLLAVPVLADDLVLLNGTIIDGSGNPRVRGNIRIRDGKITDVGSFKPGAGEITIDVKGLVIAPGFIDIHNHSSAALKDNPDAVSQVMQGITTAILGPDGGGPIAVEDFMRPFDESLLALNVGTFVGHATIRRYAMGDDANRAATPRELKMMEDAVEFAMREGALGLSTGLEYDPGFYSTTDELVMLARAAAKYGGIYMTHMRDEGDKVMDALREAIDIGRRAKIPVHISHIKLGTVGVWGKTAPALALIDQARAKAVDITADAYPYNAWSSSISVLVPSRKFDDPLIVEKGLADVGGAKNVLLTNVRNHPEYNFKTLEDVARQLNISAVQLFMNIMNDGGAGVVGSSMAEDDVRALMKYRWTMIASDGGIDARHPRGAGTFPRVLGHYVREQKLFNLETAVRKMTAMPAARLGLKQRGLLKAGNAADIVVFDPATIRDLSTFQDPMALPLGMQYVFVNGTMVIKEGKSTGARPGVALR